MARENIESLSNERPNDPEAIERNGRERELLTILADGLAEIVAALDAFSKDKTQPILLGRAADVAKSVGDQFKAWWGKQRGCRDWLGDADVNAWRRHGNARVARRPRYELLCYCGRGRAHRERRYRRFKASKEITLTGLHVTTGGNRTLAELFVWLVGSRAGKIVA